MLILEILEMISGLDDGCQVVWYLKALSLVFQRVIRTLSGGLMHMQALTQG